MTEFCGSLCAYKDEVLQLLFLSIEVRDTPVDKAAWVSKYQMGDYIYLSS